MKQVLQRMAEYNGKSADALLAIIEKVPADIRTKDVGIFYKSIDGTVEHMAWAFALWLKRFSGFGSYPCLAASGMMSRPIDEIGAEIKGDGAKAIALLREANALIERFVNELPVVEFERHVSYNGTDGKVFERTLWHAIFHVLNHGTHHRGEISAILDQNGIANDCSGFSLYIH